MADTPTTIANQVLDAIGVRFTLGDIEDGTREAQVMLRAYAQCVQQLSRAAHWDWCRKSEPLLLLADRTGEVAQNAQGMNVGNDVPDGWVYEYQYPTDCLRMRYVPIGYGNSAEPSSNISIPSTPLYSGANQQPPCGSRPRPARFLITADTRNNPYQPGQIPAHGVSPAGNLVVLTNVKCARGIYTAYIPYPTMWDAQFRDALVAYLAAQTVMALYDDKKFAMALRSQQMQIAAQKVEHARASDGNEGWSNSDISVDWMATRFVGGGTTWGGYGLDGGAGVYSYGYDCGVFATGNTGAY